MLGMTGVLCANTAKVVMLSNPIDAAMETFERRYVNIAFMIIPLRLMVSIEAVLFTENCMEFKAHIKFASFVDTL